MVKKMLLFLFVSFISILNAHSTSFANLELSPEKMDAAIEVYNTEIQLFEDFYPPELYPAKKILSLYNERADLHFTRKNYHAALRDYQKVIAYIEDAELFEPADSIGGICGSLFCYQCLDDDESAKKEFSRLTRYLALYGEEIETVNWIRNSPIYSSYKNNHKNYKERIISLSLPEMTPEEFCSFQCAGYAVAASSACLKVPNLAVAALCGGCIWGLEQLCSKCCKGEGFWENCVKPLRRLFHDPEHPSNPAPHPFE